MSENNAALGDEEFGIELANIVRDYVAPLIARIEILEKQQKEFRYVGVWRENRDYQLGNFATSNGSLWHCEEPTRSRPGTDSSWKLCVKKGAFE